MRVRLVKTHEVELDGRIPHMQESGEYTSDILRRIKSLLIVSSLQEEKDLRAIKFIKQYPGEPTWEPLEELAIDPEVWNYVVEGQGFDPKLVFCHPDILLYKPVTSIYYRGLCGLSLKAARDYFGSVDGLEEGRSSARFGREKAIAMARTYNAFISTIVKSTTKWTLENGRRTVIATLGITLDGKMRNVVGTIAENRVRTLILEWLIDHSLIVEPPLTREDIREQLPKICTLKGNTIVQFGSEPDVSFARGAVLLAVVEVKGGIDPAGALERYGAATKSFRQSIAESPQCENFYLGAVFTSELKRRISRDRLVKRYFDIIEILRDPKARERFFAELFHHTLRLI